MTHQKINQSSDGTQRQTSPTSRPTSHNASSGLAQSTLINVIDTREATSHKPRLGSSAVVVASEDRGEGLVRLAYMGDGCGGSRDAAGLSNAAPLGYSPAEDGPSGPVSRRRVDDLRVRGTRTNITNFLENGNPRAAQTFARQRAELRLGRVFPSAAWRACHRSISGRSHRLGRPRPRSRTGRGISG